MSKEIWQSLVKVDKSLKIKAFNIKELCDLKKYSELFTAMVMYFDEKKQKDFQRFVTANKTKIEKQSH